MNPITYKETAEIPVENASFAKRAALYTIGKFINPLSYRFFSYVIFCS